MYTRLLLALFLALIFQEAIIAQEKVKTEKSAFKTEKEGFSEAWKNLRKGDKLYDLGGGLYSDALDYYTKALTYNSGNASLNYKAGICALKSNKFSEALDYFLTAREIDPDVANDLLLNTGRAYHYAGDFGKALDCYNMYSDRIVSEGSSDATVTRLIKQCDMAIELSPLESTAKIINMGRGVNSPEDDYSPVLSSDGNVLYFTSRRNVSGAKDRQNQDMKWDESIFVATGSGNEFNQSAPAGDALSTASNEGVLWVDPENSIMYIYAGWTGKGDIYLSEYKKGKWSNPEMPRIPVNSNATETSISFTGDGNEVFFTSDRKGTLGGRDVFSMKRVKKNKWTKPYNAGPGVNSAGNEEGAWISEGGDTLWFSSNGREGLGGFDIFMSVREENGTWGEAVNLGPPVNSQKNDIFYRPSGSSGNTFVFSSDRQGGEGGLDLYRVEYTPVVALPDTVPLQTDVVQDTLLMRNPR